MGLFEITEEELYQDALRLPLDAKIPKALMLIKEFSEKALELSPEGYYVAFSGGKDSIVMAKLFELAGVPFRLNYNNVTIDPPELVRFIREYYPQAIWHSVGLSLPHYMAKSSNGPPTRLTRWCCEIYKEGGGTGKFKAIGVRAAESPRRKGLWQTVTADKKSTGGFFLCPILYWTDKDIWKFIKLYGLCYCSLYDEGFKRLGCIGCPLGGSNNQKRQFRRWPRYEKLWKRGFQMYWDTYHGTARKDGKERTWLNKFKTVDELWAWWISGKATKGKRPDCQQWLW